MKTYMVILKDDVILNTDIFNYFIEMDCAIVDYYPRFKALKLESKKALKQTALKYIKSIEEEKNFNL
ncbi:hypothetical protein ACFFU9_13650 [Mariniflexile ostreae]|uniref:Uncharacterized protein n=1 Tax=Mariniflexile ostreae TaxID=1520892 RepID=A0ABV5FED6_9FLAO